MEADKASAYARIALDIAQRISRGELKENTRIYGRSIMASEYGVSPETIRRSMKLLADMGIVKIMENSGSVVASAENAAIYVQKYIKQNEVRSRQLRLEELVRQHAEIGRQIAELAASIINLRQYFPGEAPSAHYESEVPAGSPLAGRSLGGVQFRQVTGATVIAVRRGCQTFISPDAGMALESGDIILFVGGMDCPAAVGRFLSVKS